MNTKIITYKLPPKNTVYKIADNKLVFEGIKDYPTKIIICSNPNHPGEFQVQTMTEAINGFDGIPNPNIGKKYVTKFHHVKSNGDETGPIWSASIFVEDMAKGAKTLFKTNQIKSRWNGKFTAHTSGKQMPDNISFYLDHDREGEDIELFLI